MTVIRPNSVSGITSITAQANEINVFRSNGTLAGLNLNGVNFNTTAGISTLAALKVTGNLDVEGVLTYQDVTNVDSLGIGTFRTGINVSGGQLDVGSNIKLGNAGVITATSFVGSGAQLTGLPAGTTINNNANNRIITGSGTANTLEGESNFTYDGNEVAVYAQTDDTDCVLSLVGKTASGGVGQAGRTAIIAESSNNSNGQSKMHFRTRNSSNAQLIAMTINGNQNVGIGITTPDAFYTHAKNLVIGSGSGGEGITIFSGTSDSGYIGFNDTASNSMQGYIQYNHNGNYMAFGPNGTEKVRITSAGSLMINKTSSFGSVPLQVVGASSGLSDGGQIFDIGTANGSAGTRLAFGVNEDNFGWIRSYESGVGGRDIVFAASDEKLRIKTDSSLLHTRTDNTTRYDFEFRNTGGISDGNYGGIKFTQGSTGATGLAAMRIAYASTGQPDIAFATRQSGGNSLTDALRIHKNGDLSLPVVGSKIYTNNSGGNLTIQGGATYPGSAIKFNGGTNGGTGVMHFYAGNSTSYQERMRITAGGQVVKYDQAGFGASNMNGWTNIGGSTYAVTSYGTVHHNYGSHFNSSNGRFTAPVDGRYLMTAIGMGVNNSNPHIAFGINNSSNGGGPSRGGTNYGNNDMWSHPSNSGYWVCLTHILDLSANDYVRVYTYDWNSSQDAPRTYFYGYLLG